MSKIFTLEKLSIIPGQYSILGKGFKKSGSKLGIFLVGKHEYKSINNIEDIKVGYQIGLSGGVADFMQTSPVQEIEEIGLNYIQFKTRTSTYILQEGTDE